MTKRTSAGCDLSLVLVALLDGCALQSSDARLGRGSDPRDGPHTHSVRSTGNTSPIPMEKRAGKSR